MKQFTTCANMANSFFNVLQGYTKSIRFVTIFTILFTIGVGNMWADYTITFKSNTKNEDGSTAQTSIANLISSGSENVSTISAAKAYNGKSGYGVKLGSSSDVGYVTMNLVSAAQIKASKLVVSAACYDSGKTLKVTVTYTDNETTTKTLTPASTITAYDVELTATKTIKIIKIESVTTNKGRMYCSSIKVVAPTWKLKGSWDGWTEHAMTVNGTEASCKVTLAAGKRYEFGFDGNGAFYKNNGVIIVPISGWVFNTSDGNCKLHTGPAGEYTFKINTSNKQVTVIYPEVTHPHQNYVYFKNSDVWGTVKGYLGNTGNSNKASEWPGIDMPTTIICDETYHYGALSDCGGLYNVIIFNNGNSGYGNQTSDLTVSGSGGKYNANRDANWHDFTTYTITFKGNGNTGGSMSNVTGIPCEGSTTLEANGFTRTGYTFNNWKTDVAVTANGSSVTVSGTVANQAELTNIKSNITLTAQWKANTYYVKFNANNGTGSMSNQNFTYDAAQNLTANAFTRTGYRFAGWNTAANGSGTSYADKASVKNLSSTNGATINLYAQWTPITYYVQFNGNGSTGGSMSNQTFKYGTAQKLTANAFTCTGYKFAGWNRAANGSDTSYDDEEEVENLTTTNGETITLYAQWDKLYTVTFYNIGILLETKMQETVGGSIECPTINAPCDGYEFVGWSKTVVANNSTSYTNVSCPFTPTEDTDLHAVYSQIGTGVGTTAISIKTYQDGTYYLIDSFTDANSKTTYHSPKGTNAGKLSSVDLTNVVTIEDGILTLDITSNSLTEDMKYTISKENDTYKIYNAETEAYVEPSANGTNFKNTGASGWSIDDENNRFMFFYSTRAFLYQDSYNSNGTKIYGRQFGNYASSVAGTITNQSGKECYGSGYFFLVPATGGSTTTYTTTPDCCTPLDEITGLTFSAMTRSITVSVPDSYDDTNVDGYIFNLYNAATGGVATTYDTNDKNEKSHTFTGLTPNTAYHFTIIAKGSGAYCNSEETSPRESYTTLPQYTVTWKPAGGHWNDNYSDKVDTYDYQATITQPANPERIGYTFNGWNTTPATIMPAENLTYTAQWNIVTYTITYENLNGATHTNPKDYTVETATITLTDPTKRAGYVFAGWYSDANYTTKVTQIPQGSTGNITLYAKWIAIYSVTWMVNGSEYTEGNPDTEVLDGDKVESLPTPPTPDEGNNIYCGEVFAGWTDKPIDGQTDAYPDLLFTTIEGSPEIKQNTTFYAVFADYQ